MTDTRRWTHVVLTLVSLLALRAAVVADELRISQRTAIAEVDRRADELREVNRKIWELAEIGLEERQSSALLISALRAAGFRVREGVAGMPTAFVASYGSGEPVIGILAEYDALPGMSQRIAPEREPVVEGGNGHACGHSGLGAGALGAALATRVAMEEHGLRGTLRLYGTPAEETVIGKVYMTLAGEFDDLDACLHWHPSTRNGAWAGSSKALVSAKFTFHGTPAHASVSPDSGRSALDAVELMNAGVNAMREHVREDARLHYVITDGGGAPNVVPPRATVWYFCRADSHRDVEYNFRWLQDIARGAAMMTRTRLEIAIDTDCHEIVRNDTLSAVIDANLRAIGPPRHSEEEIAFARKLQAPLVEQFEREFPVAIESTVEPLVEEPEPSKGSTDVGDISWRVPTGGLRTACFAAGSPGHSWQNVAAIGSTIGEKGILYAARALAATAVDLLERPELRAAARAEWKKRMEGRSYFSFIPEGQRAPGAIR